MERENPRPGERYRHFKGNLYQVITVALHAKDKEELVVYQALYPPFRVYARSVSSFFAQIDATKYPDAQQPYRFVKVTDLDDCVGMAGKKNSASQKETTIHREEEGEGQKELLKNQKITESDIKKIENSHKKPQAAQEESEVRRREIETVQKKNDLPQQKERQTEENIQGVNPVLLEFLDATTLHEKVNILRERKNQLDDKCITDLATVMDLAIEKGDFDTRYQQLVSCLEMMKRFEVFRR